MKVEKPFDAYNVWHPEKYPSQSNDIRYKTLRYAILAANTHNIQPWKLRLKNKDTIYLYIDSSRLLRYTDPDLRHIYLSQGTFIETFTIAASHFGYQCEVNLFPLGIPSLEKPDEFPVASIVMKKDDYMQEDELFREITKRCTSHAVFNNKEITKEQQEELYHSNNYINHGFELHILDDSYMMREISKLLIKAMMIQCNTSGPHSETIKMIRFRKKHLYDLKDGFSFSDLGVTGFKLKLAERFATPYMANSAFFKANVVKSIKKMSESAKAFGIIYAPQDTRETQIISGRIFCNAQLRASYLGLSFQPMDHVFQKYAELHDVENAMFSLLKHNDSKKIPMAIFRVGYSDYATCHTPRRSVDNMIINAEQLH